MDPITNIDHYRELRERARAEYKRRIMSKEERHARASTMVQLRYVEGLTLAAIGKRYGLTRERVRQIIDAFLDKNTLNK